MDAQKKQSNEVEETSVDTLVSGGENHELGIKRIRTFAEDLALAKEKAGVVDEAPSKRRGGFFSKRKKDDRPKPVPKKKDLSKIQPEVDISKAPHIEEKVKTVTASKEYIEQELAKSGIVTAESIEKKEVEKEKTSISPIRTYKYDAAESIQKKGTSKISMLAAEQKRRVANKDFSKTFEGNQSVGMSMTLVIISIILVAGGIWGGIHFYNKSKVTDEAVVVVSKTLLFTDKKIDIDSTGLKGPEFRDLIQNSKNDVNGRLNDLAEITLQDRGIFGDSKISKNDLFNKIEGSVPARLTRNLNEDYIVGVHSGNVASIFYIFRIDDFDTVFAGVLEWENSMRRDLYAEAIGTTFEDTYLRNKDTRIQKDNFGNTKLIYSFPNSETLLITETEEAFFEIFERLTVSSATQN